MLLSAANPLMSGLTATPEADNDNNNSGSANNAQSSNSLENNFLLMLTTELKEQDPMSPMDNSQMVSQLSQIASTQGINDLKGLMQTNIMTQIGTQRLASAQLIGKNVDFKTQAITVNDAKTQYAGTIQEPDKDVNSLTLNITDSTGKVTMKTITVNRDASGNFSWKWDGTNNQGVRVANGTYQVAASSSTQGSADKADIYLRDQVSRVNFTSDGTTELAFVDGQTTDMQDVNSIET